MVGKPISTQENSQLNYNGEKENSQMAKYHVNPHAIEDVDCSVLIEAVARHISAEEFPSIDGIAAILGIERVEEEDG